MPFKLSLAMWLVMSCIFTSSYTGIAINEIASPFPLKGPENFQHLSGHDCYKNVSCIFSGKCENWPEECTTSKIDDYYS